MGASLPMTYITSIMPTFHNLPRYGASLAENLIALLAAGHQRIRAKPRFASIYRETRFLIGRRNAWSINFDETRLEEALVCSRRVNFHPWDACPFCEYNGPWSILKGTLLKAKVFFILIKNSMGKNSFEFMELKQVDIVNRNYWNF